MYPDLLVGYQNPALFRGPGIKVVSGRRKRAVEDVVKSWKRELGKPVVSGFMRFMENWPQGGVYRTKSLIPWILSHLLLC